MKSHTGAMLMFSKRAVFSMSNKQKLNYMSSTVAEIIGDNYAMNFVIGVKLFTKQQVKTFPDDSIIKRLGSQLSVIQHNNTSNIYLEVNGK